MGSGEPDPHGCGRGRVRAGAARAPHAVAVGQADTLGRDRRRARSRPRPLGAATMPTARRALVGCVRTAVRPPLRGGLGCGELLRAGEVPWVDRRSRRVRRRDAPPLRAVPGRTDGRAESLLPRQPSLLERDLHRRGQGPRAGRMRRSPRGSGRPVLRGTTGPPAEERSHRDPAIAAAKRRVLDSLAQQTFAGTLPAGLHAFALDPRAADYARFRAEVERRGTWWGAWPTTHSEGSLTGVSASKTTGRATTCSSSGWRPSSCRRPPAARARPAASCSNLRSG